MSYYSSQSYRNKMENGGYQRLGGRRKSTSLFNRCRVSVLQEQSSEDWLRSNVIHLTVLNCTLNNGKDGLKKQAGIND